MKITRIEKWKVVVPMRPDSINSPEYTSEDDELSTFWKVPKHIIRIHTSDSGIVGIGETGRGCPASDVDRAIAALVGKEVESIDLHRHEVTKERHSFPLRSLNSSSMHTRNMFMINHLILMLK